MRASVRVYTTTVIRKATVHYALKCVCVRASVRVYTTTVIRKTTVQCGLGFLPVVSTDRPLLGYSARYSYSCLATHARA